MEQSPTSNFVILGGSQQKRLTPFPNNDHTRKIIKRTQIEKEAWELEKQGLYEQAIKKYQEALDPSLLNYEYDKGMALGGICRIHIKQGKFELAL